MPHNYEQFEVIQVAFPRNSPVLARLKEEAKRYTGRANAGPHIFELLVDRDAHIYGEAEGQGKGIWFPPNYQVVVQVSQTRVQDEVHVEQTDVVEEADATDIDLQAASMAAAFRDDDDE
jgi:hypothetical protein